MEANGDAGGKIDELEIKRDFTKEEVDGYLKEIDLSKVNEFYFVCNPTKPEMPRHISLRRSKVSSPDWNPEKHKGSYFYEFLQDIKAQEEKVQKYYQANEEQFKDVHTWNGQMRLAEATGVHGESIFFRTCPSKGLIRITNKERRAKAFLAFAKRLNDGQFVEDTTFVLSLKSSKRKRVQLDIYSSRFWTENRTNIRRILEESACEDFCGSANSHVASYLNRLPEFRSLKLKFEPLPGSFDLSMAMQTEGDYTKRWLEIFLNKISLEELKKVNAIHLTFNPMKPNMLRHLLLVSQEPISSWELQWQAKNYKNSFLQKLLDQQTKQKKVVQDYYKENKDSFEDVSRLVSQIQIENATGVHGGSLLLDSQGPYEKAKHNLAKIFLHLARALNRGHFDVDSTFTVSFEIFPEKRNCRVKLHMQSRKRMALILRKFQQVIKQQNPYAYDLKIETKTDVACYLRNLSEIRNARSFESPIKGTTDQIDEISRGLSDMKF